LFAVNDLWDNTNMVNVVQSIAALGQLANERGFLPTFTCSTPVSLGTQSSGGSIAASSCSTSLSMSSSGGGSPTSNRLSVQSNSSGASPSNTRRRASSVTGAKMNSQEVEAIKKV
jgi:hypothetical protein